MKISQRICRHFDSYSISYKLICHSETRTSEESFKARLQAAGSAVIGAKAIVMKVERKQIGVEFDVFVLPGNKKINSKALKKQLNDLKSLRFATKEEMADKTGGLVPGSMPPFAQPIFAELSRLYIDSSLLEHELIGFNIASLTQSVVLKCSDYLRVASPTKIFSFSR